jgi:hypothetical protein
MRHRGVAHAPRKLKSRAALAGQSLNDFLLEPERGRASLGDDRVRQVD